jgi:multicomponent Na+:H+ antiporter subunit B
VSDDDSDTGTGGESAPGDWTTDTPVVRNPTESTYVESQVIMTTVRAVAPFSLTYGLFLTFHGADSPGGSFQGGAIMAATVLMFAFAFGVAPTREWLRNRTVVALAAGGTATFALVGLVPMLFGDSFLAHPRFKKALDIKTKWGLEAIEVGGVAPIVAGVLVGLFFVLAAGMFRDGDATEPRTDGGAAASDRTAPSRTGEEGSPTPSTGTEARTDDAGMPAEDTTTGTGGDR